MATDLPVTNHLTWAESLHRPALAQQAIALGQLKSQVFPHCYSINGQSSAKSVISEHFGMFTFETNFERGDVNEKRR
jgi:hypothetical protein